MKIIITGAHFTPAQAVIEELKNDPHIEITYIGRQSTLEGDKTFSLESQVLPKLGVKFVPLIAGRLQRSLTAYTIPSLLKIPLGFVQAFYLVWRENPAVVLSFGGYIAVPVVFAAWLLSIPVIIHEQTLVSGLANQISTLFANKIAVSFKGHELLKNPKTVLTGNPLRREIKEANLEKMGNDYQQIISISQKEKLPLIYITGGNQGSHIINEAILEILDRLTGIACVVHQTGDSRFKDFEKLVAAKNNLKNPQHYLVNKWDQAKDVGVILQKVDFVISRAGINILSELAYFQTPVLLIPIPYLYKNEQTVNANFFAELGLAQILPQKDLSGERLLREIEKMIIDLPDLNKNAKPAKEIIIADAPKRLALETLLLARN